MTEEGTSSLAPTPEVIARRLRDLRQAAGQHEAQLGRHGEQLASIGEQLRELARLQQLASTRHADLAAAVAEDLAVKVDALSTLVRRGARFAVHLRVTRVALGGLVDPVAGAHRTSATGTCRRVSCRRA